MSTTSDVPMNVASARQPGTRVRLQRLWTYRNLLLNLVRRDLRIRYKESALGFIWSLLNPMMYLAIFYVVFVVLLPAGIPHFTIFILSGLLPWTLFQNTLASATNAVVGGAPLIKRVAFPREVLPFATIGANLFQFCVQTVVLFSFIVIFRYHFVSWYLLLVIPALVVEVLLLAGFSLILSALTPYLRDLAHFMELALLFWFWLTPVVYQPRMLFDHLTTNHHVPFSVAFLNPMVLIVMIFQRAFYHTVNPQFTPPHSAVPHTVNILVGFPFIYYTEWLAVVGVVSVLFAWFGFWVFGRCEGNFAEEL